MAAVSTRCFAQERIGFLELPSPKRRRVPVEELAGELRRAGLAQPALSVLSPHGEATREAPRAKRAGEEAGASLCAKRCRASKSPLEVPGLAAEDASRAAAALSSSIVPYRGGKAAPLLQPPRRPCVRSIAVDPLCSAFVVADCGVLLADLPPRHRPEVFFPEVGSVEVARICIDAQGTAFVFAEDDRLLTVVPAIRYLEDCGRKDDDIQIQFFVGHGSGRC